MTGFPAFRCDLHQFMSQLKTDVGVENVNAYRVLNAFYRLLCDRETGRTHDFRVTLRQIIGVIGKVGPNSLLLKELLLMLILFRARITE